MSETGEFDITHTQELPELPKNDTEKVPVMQKTMSRRTVTKKGAVGAAAIVLGGAMGFDKLKSSKQEDPVVTPDSVVAPIPEESPEYTTHEQLNMILAQEIFSHERILDEIRYAEQVVTLEDIDKGLSVCADIGARIRLLEKRAELRSQKPDEMIQLNEAHKNFCKENGVDEEILGMCLDAYNGAEKIITALQSKIRIDEKGKLVDPEMLMINAGGMAKLIMEETSGFINVGGKKAMTQLTQEYDREALVTVCKLATQNTGLRFNANNVPGSDIVNPEANFSGGAIGIQFMPSRALEYYQKIVEEGGFDPKSEGNIFDPIQSIKMAWTFIACHERVGDGPHDFRWGYMKGDPEAIELAIRKWNNLDSEVNAIKDAAYDYYDDVESEQNP